MAHRMPPEWAPHRRTWMAWPRHAETVAAIGGRAAAEAAWATVARAVAAFEPVTVVCDPADAAAARAALGEGVPLAEMPVGDGWIRDSGPTFVADGAGGLAAVDWTFNGWGGRTFPEAAADALVARRVAEAAGARRIPSRLVAEGGGIHVDGEGTLLLTESVLLNPNRNPSWTRAEVEGELHARLGTRKAIWLPRGLVADTGPFGTDGHVDTLACFVAPGRVVVHGQPDPAHPDHATAREIAAILAGETDARGRPLEVVALDAPAERHDADGAPLSCSYVNFLFVNGGIVMPAFGDPADARAAETLARLRPERRVVPVDAVRLFMGGGGVHCITQQEPLIGQGG
jgi:agmatine deiminase